MDDFLEQTAVRKSRGIFSLLYYMAWIGVVLFALVAAVGLRGVIGVNPETGGLMFSLTSLIVMVVFGDKLTFLIR